jgi:hypothetical protein
MLLRLSVLGEQLPEVARMDLNPVIVSAAGPPPPARLKLSGRSLPRVW